mmetsp:Transcript_1043/g.2255  ORF Transcript_1043/g.2255 Transcript_1043/m.2255 type:complete len:219 (-) Transcript_1043:1363-2019(-)
MRATTWMRPMRSSDCPRWTPPAWRCRTSTCRPPAGRIRRRTRTGIRWRRSTDSASTRTISASRCRRCRSGPPWGSCPGAWMCSWDRTWWTGASRGTGYAWWGCTARSPPPTGPRPAGSSRRWCSATTSGCSGRTPPRAPDSSRSTTCAKSNRSAPGRTCWTFLEGAPRPPSTDTDRSNGRSCCSCWGAADGTSTMARTSVGTLTFSWWGIPVRPSRRF